MSSLRYLNELMKYPATLHWLGVLKGLRSLDFVVQEWHLKFQVSLFPGMVKICLLGFLVLTTISILNVMRSIWTAGICKIMKTIQNSHQQRNLSKLFPWFLVIKPNILYFEYLLLKLHVIYYPWFISIYLHIHIINHFKTRSL